MFLRMKHIVFSILFAHFCRIFVNPTVFLENPGQTISDFVISEKVPELIPRRVLYDNPEITHVRIDPSGKYLAFLKPKNGVLNIWAQNLEDAVGRVTNAYPLTNESDNAIAGFSWTYQPDVLVYEQDTDGDENYKLYKLNVNTNEIRILTDFPGTQANILAKHYEYPDLMYIGLNNRDSRHHDLYLMNLTNGAKELIFLNTEGYSHYFFDNSMRLRLLTKQADDGGSDYFVPTFDEEYGNFTNDVTLYRKISFEDDLSTNVVGFNRENSKVYWYDSEGRDKSALILRNFEDPKQHYVIYEPKKADVTSVIFHPTLHTPQIVTETYKRARRTFFNEDVKKDLEILQKLDPEAFISFVSSSKDFTKWIFILFYDNAPLNYYYFDRTTKQSHYLFTPRPELAKFRLAKMNPVEVKTRDGYDQVCYLSLPVNKDPLGTGRPSSPVPLVMLVHGGPNSRDSWGYDRSVQHLVNRGYGVMQCNYRGSTGYGKNFIAIAEGEWGRKMHYDIVDAAKWAISQKIAIWDKIAVYGWSYGGYEALAGLTFSPEFFRCGISVVGPSNLITTITDIPPYWEILKISDIRRIGGNPDTEEGRKFLISRSPLFFADRISAPLLIAQGGNDPRVNRSESDQIFESMKENKIPVTYLLFPNEGHGFIRPENKIAFVTKMEQFLAECLGGRFEPKGEDSDGTSMDIIHEGPFL